MNFLRMTENVTPLSLMVSEFRERVAVMRALGVLQWGDIVLGPVPHVQAELSTVQDQHSQSGPGDEPEDDYVKTLLHSSGANPGPFLRKV